MTRSVQVLPRPSRLARPVVIIASIAVLMLLPAFGIGSGPSPGARWQRPASAAWTSFFTLLVIPPYWLRSTILTRAN